MAIKKYSAQIIRGLSTDTKPTTGVLPDTMFIETDTSLFYFWDDMMSEWMEHHAAAPNTSMVASMTIYRVGDMVTVRNNVTGMHEFEVDDTGTGDASAAFNYAIQNMPGGAISSGILHKGRITVGAGVYNCKTMINFDGPALGVHSMQMMGEGQATRINFVPSTALDTGLMDRMSRFHLGYMRLYGNTNVTNLMKIDATTTTPQNRWFTNLEYVLFDGAYYEDYSPPSLEAGLAHYKVGQKGLFATSSALGVYFWSIIGCFFRGLEYGAHLHNQHTTSSMQTNISFLSCRVAEKISGSQHHINNVWIQGNLDDGDIGLWFTSEGTGVGSLTNVSNVMVEMYRTATAGNKGGLGTQLTHGDITANIVPDPVGPPIVPDLHGGTVTGLPIVGLPKGGAIGILKDVGAVNHRTNNIQQTSAPGGKLVDLNPYGNFDFDEFFTPKTSKGIGSITGTWLAGAQRPGNEGGILCGNIVEDPAGTFTNNSASNGVFRQIDTLATAPNTLRCIYYSNTGAANGSSLWSRSFNPKLTVRFYTVDLTDYRIFIGLWQSYAAPSTLATVLANKNGVGLWLDQSSGNNNYRILHNDGSATATISTFPGTQQAVTTGAVLKVTIETDNDDNMYLVQLQGKYKQITTAIPASGPIGWLIAVENVTAVNRRLRIFEVEMEGRHLK